MKNFVILCLAALGAQQAAAREFTSADGNNKIEAEFVRYDPRNSKVTLRMPDGRNMVSDAGLFSEADQAFFKEEFRNSQLDGAISVRSHDKLTRDAYKKDNLLISHTDAAYIFTIKNLSEVSFESLDVKFWVVVERDNLGNPHNETFDGSTTIAKLDKEAEAKVEGPKIRLITGAAPNLTTKDQNQLLKVMNEAAKYGRDRAIGWRVEVKTADGKQLYADSSSNRVDKALGLDPK